MIFLSSSLFASSPSTIALFFLGYDYITQLTVLSAQLQLGFNSRKGGIPESREILAAGNSREIFIFSRNSRHRYYHENLTILLAFGGFLSILCQQFLLSMQNCPERKYLNYSPVIQNKHLNFAIKKIRLRYNIAITPVIDKLG